MKTPGGTQRLKEEFRLNWAKDNLEAITEVGHRLEESWSRVQSEHGVYMPFGKIVQMDLLCQETRDACKDSSESLRSPCSQLSQCQKGSLAEESEAWVPGTSTVTANKSLSLTVL